MSDMVTVRMLDGEDNVVGVGDIDVNYADKWNSISKYIQLGSVSFKNFNNKLKDLTWTLLTLPRF